MPGRNLSWCHPISQISLPRKPTAPCRNYPLARRWQVYRHLPQLPTAFVIRAIALLTHAGLVVKCLSSLTCKHVILAIRLTTLSNKNSSYPTSEYLPPICLISEYGNLFRYSYPLTQESRPQLLGSLSPGVSQTHSIGNSILSSTTDSSL